jgi:shikimate kinase
MMKKDVIFLVGFMGSGKSVIGRALADKLGYQFLDTDDMVEEKEGRSIEQIFRESGEGYFREKEWEALISLKGLSKTVISTGGGLFLGRQHRELIKEQGVSVWLDAPIEEILGRLKGSSSRPLFKDEKSLKELLENRKARYALADFTVKTDRLTIDEIVKGVVEALDVQ